MSDHDDGLEVDVGNIEAEAELNHTAEEGKEEHQESQDDNQASGYVETDDPKIKARLGQLTREKYENERAKAKAEAEVAALRKELEALKAPRPVEAPSADLAIDDPAAFKAQQEKYADYLKDQALHEADKRRSEEAIKAEEQRKLEADIKSYNERAEALKISKQELLEAGTIVGTSGIAKEVVEYLLTHESGPAIVKQLADKPEELETLRNLPPYRATAYIERLFTGQQKPKNDPPPPPTRVNGVRASGTKAADGTLYE